jgi:peptidoglycan/xylan/chitin deacetylase (PgdA/CDA1 family)
VKRLTLFSLSFLFFACSHQPLALGRRLPASFTSHLSEGTQRDLKEIVGRENSPRLQQLFLGTRIAQTLVSSFDERLGKAEGEKGLDALLSSRLYCKLQRTRALHEAIEEKITYALQTAFEDGNPAWFFSELSRFAAKDSASAAAAGQLLIQLSGEEESLCGKENCVREAMPAFALPFNPFDESFSRFLTGHQSEIALYANPSKTDLLPGDCMDSAAREPSQQAAYDWNKRNWVQSNLNNGEFVITYDDGPHASITEQMMEVWKNTSYPRPAFFWLSENAKRLSAIVQKAQKDGFNIGCHTERHADLGNLAKAASAGALNSVNRETFGSELKSVSPAEFASWKSRTLDREILEAARTVESIVQKADPSFHLHRFRLPYGSGLRNPMIGDRFAELNVDHFFWKVDSLDWQDKNPGSVHKRVVSQMKAGKKGIILFHDIQAPTVKTTQLLLETFRKTPGWKPVSIQQMVP